MLTRRRLLIHSATASAFVGLQRLAFAGSESRVPKSHAFGPLRADPEGVFDLPRDFSYTVLARTGEEMDDGLLMPGDPDGMAAFTAGDGRVALVCNHELDPSEVAEGPFGAKSGRLDRLAADRVYDRGGPVPGMGGTTTRLYNPETRRLERRWLSLAGTERNCAGGPTPWGSWLSCEESVSRVDDYHGRDHGWVFEVPASAREAVRPVPLKAMGRFNHEAVAVDPRTGIVYLTEDRHDGLLYRFLPDEPGELAAGGRLQALALTDPTQADTRNWPEMSGPDLEPGQALAIRWLDLEDIESPADDLRLRGHAGGAALFARGEGMWYGNGEVYFACTGGGALKAGQIFRYRPSAAEGKDDEAESPGRLELFVESANTDLLRACDNLTVAPWGDLIVCEDRPDGASLVGVDPQGRMYEFGRNAYSSSELAGACFSPDGRTLFVNIQSDGLTLAVHGPFPDSANS